MTSNVYQSVDTQDASALASCLRRDQELCRAGLRPSPLALYLPPAASPLADAISEHLVDHGDKETAKVPFMPKSVKQMWYTSILQGLKDRLAEIDARGINNNDVDTSAAPANDDLEVAVSVLEYFQATPDTQITAATSLGDVITVLRNRILSSHDQTNPALRSKQEVHKCYICHFTIWKSHPSYPSLCYPCGSFNIAESNLSLPGSLNLKSKTALVTGGRVNLGFHCALRLLRCGARTIVSTRYPLDAETRYRAEPDFHDWEDRLRIVGADFRTAKDAFGLVTAVKMVLREWEEEQAVVTGGGLFLLVNNAAQTLTDSIQNEMAAIRREDNLRTSSDIGTLQVEFRGRYLARIRGGVVGAMLEGVSAEPTIGETAASIPGSKSSWMQSLTEIPYEDMITAQSVNAFVPLILCRELLPIMGLQQASMHSKRLSDKPLGYIVNVSSREGLFEAYPNHRAKAGVHVHTNMSKAALNMLTETEAASAWKFQRVAMNTVDPGYMSAAPEMQRNDCPIGFEDGAARILWPIAIGETQGTAVWGRFLKHFGKVAVEVQRGG
jgi:NAD(P)-dependent dehydrogenase (short-subunit alcohol dehydrogenase family)